MKNGLVSRRPWELPVHYVCGVIERFSTNACTRLPSGYSIWTMNKGFSANIFPSHSIRSNYRLFPQSLNIHSLADLATLKEQGHAAVARSVENMSVGAYADRRRCGES